MLKTAQVAFRTSTKIGAFRSIHGSPLLSEKLQLLGETYQTDSWTNVPQSMLRAVGRNLHKNENHPVGIVRSLIEERLNGMGYTSYNDFSPVVSTYLNFDSLGFPPDHPGRSKTDTYYINEKTILRTHTSAHELECFQTCETPGYLISADVYRRDTIDKTHYSAFHQMEGARVWKRDEDLIQRLKDDIAAIPESGLIIEDNNPAFSPSNPKQPHMNDEEVDLVSQHLKRTIELVMGHVFTRAKQAAIEAGSTDPDLFQPIKARWNGDAFPWTGPSYEIEIWWKGQWLEMCGCGVVQQHLLDKAGISDSISWAFGIGLDRTAMILFGIPDIRLFWSEDNRFCTQFNQGKVTMFKPYSKYPSTTRDIAFWCPANDPDAVHVNEFAEIVRSEGGDLVENIELVDEFKHPKTNRLSQCYRITYQAMDRNLTNDEINEIQSRIVKEVPKKFPVEIR